MFSSGPAEKKTGPREGARWVPPKLCAGSSPTLNDTQPERTALGQQEMPRAGIRAEVGLGRPCVVDEAKTRAYYDDFSADYEARRGQSVPRGYHELLDHLESETVERYGKHRDVLEVGCGTGLILERIRHFATRAEGIDLSPGMLKKARARGLSVREGSATELPYGDETFDVTCSFKVLAHVPDIELALAEMARVTRRGGFVLAEFYNPRSFRGLLRGLGPSRSVGKKHKESDVLTRFDTPQTARALAPPGTTFVAARGIRILTPAARFVDNPITGPLLFRAECWAADSFLKDFGGFYVAIYQKGRSLP